VPGEQREHGISDVEFQVPQPARSHHPNEDGLASGHVDQAFGGQAVNGQQPDLPSVVEFDDDSRRLTGGDARGPGQAPPDPPPHR
jgi:hypothetical protein